MKTTLLIFLALTTLGFSGDEKKLKPIPDKLVVLSFDDCNKSDHSFVAGILKEHQFGATFYVTEGLGFRLNKKHYTTWKEIKELDKMGFEIGNHTKSHPNLARLSAAQVDAEAAHIDKRCAEHQIAKPTTFCYPGFQHNRTVVDAIMARGYKFARRGVGPEHADGGKGARGPAYDPLTDHPLLVPTTGYAGPDWGMDDLKWAVDQAKGGKIAVLCFHGVPALDHPWVNCTPADFRNYMEYLNDEGCKVIAMRDLSQYVDPEKRPQDPYAPIRKRVAEKKAKAEADKSHREGQ